MFLERPRVRFDGELNSRATEICCADFDKYMSSFSIPDLSTISIFRGNHSKNKAGNMLHDGKRFLLSSFLKICFFL